MPNPFILNVEICSIRLLNRENVMVVVVVFVEWQSQLGYKMWKYIFILNHLDRKHINHIKDKSRTSCKRSLGVDKGSIGYWHDTNGQLTQQGNPFRVGLIGLIANQSIGKMVRTGRLLKLAYIMKCSFYALLHKRLFVYFTFHNRLSRCRVVNH